MASRRLFLFFYDRIRYSATSFLPFFAFEWRGSFSEIHLTSKRCNRYPNNGTYLRKPWKSDERCQIACTLGIVALSHSRKPDWPSSFRFLCNPRKINVPATSSSYRENSLLINRERNLQRGNTPRREDPWSTKPLTGFLRIITLFALLINSLRLGVANARPTFPINRSSSHPGEALHVHLGMQAAVRQEWTIDSGRCIGRADKMPMEPPFERGAPAGWSMLRGLPSLSHRTSVRSIDPVYLPGPYRSLLRSDRKPLSLRILVEERKREGDGRRTDETRRSDEDPRVPELTGNCQERILSRSRVS